jgi:hypothetical protein
LFIAICTFSVWLAREEGVILSTVPGTVELACSATRVLSKFKVAILADLAMRGFRISFLTLACVIRSDFVFLLVRRMHPS